MDIIQWLLENWPAVLVILYGVLNVLNAVLKLVPGDQGEESGGWFHTMRKLLDSLSVLVPRDAAGTLKAPLTSSKPVEPTE